MTEKTGRSRRRVLRAASTGILVGAGGIGTSVSSAAATTEENNAWSIEELSPREKGQLRGRVMSSSAFKAVRRAARDRGFRPRFDAVTGSRLKNEETGTERIAMRIPCEYDGATDERRKTAVIYALEDDERIQVRCLSQYEGEPITIDTCIKPRSENGAAAEADVTVTRILTAEEGA